MDENKFCPPSQGESKSNTILFQMQNNNETENGNMSNACDYNKTKNDNCYTTVDHPQHHRHLYLSHLGNIKTGLCRTNHE